jgi:hypothetical protein
MKSYFAILLCIFYLSSNAQNLVINEICPVNNGLILDNYNEKSDWFELKNIGVSTIQLSDYSVSIKNAKTSPWQLPTKILNPGDIYLVFSSKLNEVKNDTAHTDFSMDRFDDELTLFFNGSVVDQIDWEELYSDVSIGRNASSSLKYYNTPTPYLENTTTEYLGICRPPEFSNSSQFFSSSISLTLTGSHPIFYSFQLDSPSVSSLSYNTAIIFDTTLVISARCIAADYISSKIIYKSYIKDKAPDFPVVFFHTDPKNLFSNDYGIFEKGNNADPNFPFLGANFWTTEEFRGYIDFISPSKQILFSGNVGFKPHGGASARNKPQIPLRLIFREDYGEKRLKAKLFTTKEATKFKRLVLRNSGGDFNNTHFRDAIIHQLMMKDELHLELTGYTPVRAYINGENWGVYNLREKVGKQYIESNTGIHRDSINLIEESYNIINGDSMDHYNLVQYAMNNDLAIAANYNYVSERLDIENLVDYFSSEMILANADWPNNNLKLWKPITGGKWRYIFFDLDASLANLSFVGSNYNMWARFQLTRSLVNHHVNLFKELMKNSNFSRYFVNRYSDLMNTTFSVERFYVEVASVKNHLYPQMDYHFNKWGNTYEQWEADIEKMSPWIEERAVFQRKNLQDSVGTGAPYQLTFDVFPPKAGSIDLNTIHLNSFPWSGYYFNNNTIDIKINENEGFRFKHWLIHSNETIYTTDSINIDFTDDDEITAIFTSDLPIVNTLKIFPSPAQFGKAITLKFLQYEKTKRTIEIFNGSGERVFIDEQNESLLGNKTIEIELNNLANGLYIVRVLGDDFVLTNKLIIE